MPKKLGFIIALCAIAACERAESTGSAPLDGRQLLIFAPEVSEREPRFPGIRGAQVFGMNVDGMKPGEPVSFSPDFGHNSMYIKKIVARMNATAPEGADLASWGY